MYSTWSWASLFITIRLLVKTLPRCQETAFHLMKLVEHVRNLNKAFFKKIKNLAIHLKNSLSAGYMQFLLNYLKLKEFAELIIAGIEMQKLQL